MLEMALRYTKHRRRHLNARRSLLLFLVVGCAAYALHDQTLAGGSRASNGVAAWRPSVNIGGGCSRLSRFDVSILRRRSQDCHCLAACRICDCESTTSPVINSADIPKTRTPNRPQINIPVELAFKGTGAPCRPTEAPPPHSAQACRALYRSGGGAAAARRPGYLCDANPCGAARR